MGETKPQTETPTTRQWAESSNLSPDDFDEMAGENGETDERIRHRAYEIWEEEGRPEGRHEDHWRRAREEIARQGLPRQGLQ